MIIKQIGIFILIAIITLLFIIFHYVKNRAKVKYKLNPDMKQNIVSYPNAEFAVISDLHYYDKCLGITGDAFEKCLESDRKLLKESSELINLAIDNIIKSKVKFVLMPGDLTKDGEMLCHENIAKSFSRLKQNGIKVYVIPGNHDVNNPLASKYEGNQKILVPSVTAAQFADIYKDYGYGDAIYRDTNSLSYVAEPVDNLWIIGLDTCRYKENKPGEEEIVGGKVSQKEVQWLLGILEKAKENNKAVMVMQHHGIVEHWNGQSRIHSNFIVKDYEALGKFIASYGVRVAFTGHYHAQNIALGDFKNYGYIYDIETGSLLTAPCPIRYCTLHDNKMTIKSQYLVEKLYPDTDFAKNAQEFTRYTVIKEAYDTLRRYFVSEKDSKYIAEYLGDAFLAHYSGYENIENKPYFDSSKLGVWGKTIYTLQKYVIDGLWNYSPNSHNNVIIDLEKSIGDIN